jgi:hypothetical protein
MPGWARREGGVLAAMSGVALPNCNGVWAEQVNPDPDLVEALLSQVDAAGLPYCLQLRPGSSSALTDLPIARRLMPRAQVPLMVLEAPDALEAAQLVDGLEIRQLAPEAAHEHATILSGGAKWAWLQSSRDGYSVYARLGFETVERWSSWFSRS